MKIRFQADADLHRGLIIGALRRAPEIDFQSAQSIPLAGLADALVLELAAQGGRVLVSHDVNTMEGHFREFTRTRKSPGLVLIPQRTGIGLAVESLLMIWEFVDSAEIENRVCLVPSLVIY